MFANKITKMKTKIAATVLFLLLSFTATIAQDKTKSSQKKSVSTKMEMAKDSVYYTCSMHPEVNADKPGKCPKCGMALIEKN